MGRICKIVLVCSVVTIIVSAVIISFAGAAIENTAVPPINKRGTNDWENLPVSGSVSKPSRTGTLIINHNIIDYTNDVRISQKRVDVTIEGRGTAGSGIIDTIDTTEADAYGETETESDVAEVPEIAEAPEAPEIPEVLPRWRELHERNRHLVGWVKIGDTILNYPVMQYLESEFDGNSYYLEHNFDRVNDGEGVPFVDWHTPIVGKNRPDNTILYAHNFNSGKLFGTLTRYNATPRGRDLSAYYDNPTIDFTTVYDDEQNTYKIFAAMFVNTNEDHGEVFNYYQRRFFNTEDEFFDFIGNVMDRSVFYTDVDIEYGDEILTMSTCYFPLGGKSHRFVLLARRVRDGESPEVDISKAYINPSPLYFDYYYEIRGGSWQGRNWDINKVKNFR